jgi:hypothetical protein
MECAAHLELLMPRHHLSIADNPNRGQRRDLDLIEHKGHGVSSRIDRHRDVAREETDLAGAHNEPPRRKADRYRSTSQVSPEFAFGAAGRTDLKDCLGKWETSRVHHRERHQHLVQVRGTGFREEIHGVLAMAEAQFQCLFEDGALQDFSYRYWPGQRDSTQLPRSVDAGKCYD